MAIRTTPNEEKRFTSFIKELTKISNKYGVFIQSTGGVKIVWDQHLDDFIKGGYDNDISSGDLDFWLDYKDS